jgi:hypothetical protein
MELRTLLFEKAGAENTAATLKIAAERAQSLGINQVVVASYHGDSIRKAHAEMSGKGIKIVGVSVCEGWGNPDGEAIAMPKTAKAELAGLGITVHTGIQAFGGSMCEGLGGGGLTAEGVIAATLRNFSQGMKVAVECVLMVSAAGLIDMSKEVISVAGTGKGADTAIVCKPANPFNFRQLRVLEILAKPRSA